MNSLALMVLIFLALAAGLVIFRKTNFAGNLVGLVKFAFSAVALGIYLLLNLGMRKSLRTA